MAINTLPLLLCILQIGPDAVMSDLAAPARLASSTPIGSAAYGIGGNTCNLGTSPLPFAPLSAGVHPIFVQNLFRIRSGRIEQIGLSWAFHEFCPLQASDCATCAPVGGTCEGLGVGCSSFDTSSLAGSSNGLGPRSQVNPSTGIYAYPNATPAPGFPGGRVHVQNSDLDPALNTGAEYFSELLVVAPSDAAAGNNANNASHRRVHASTFTNGAWTLLNTSAVPQFDQQPAILSLQRLSPPGSVVTSTIDVPGDGRIIVASAAWYEGPRSWRYEYAVYNQSSDRAVGEFDVTIIPNLAIQITDPAFRGVTHHSGEVWASTPWDLTHIVGNVTDHWQWSTQPFATDANASAIRWGTLYNFTLHSDSPPAHGQVRLGLFKPGTPTDIFADALIPSAACPADFNHDGVHDVPDLFAFLAAWFALDPAADINGDAAITVPDVFAFLSRWFAGCD